MNEEIKAIKAYKSKKGNIHTDKKKCMKENAETELTEIFDECTAQGTFFVDELLEMMQDKKKKEKFIELINELINLV